MNISNNKILITGGATGIGLGLTERFLKENNTVIISTADNALSLANINASMCGMIWEISIFLISQLAYSIIC